MINQIVSDDLLNLKISPRCKLNIQYKILGQGKSIIFLTGGGVVYDDYLDFLELLSTKYRVITFNYPGFGNSSNIPKYSLQNFNQIIENLLKTLDVREALMVGHSLGAGLSLNYTNFQRRKVTLKGLVLVSPFIKRVNKTLIKMLFDVIKQYFISKRFNSTMSVDGRLNIYNYLRTSIFKLINSYRLFRFIKTNNPHINNHNLNYPVLGFYSTNDYSLNSEDQIEGLVSIANINIISFKNKGHHLIHTEKEKIFDEILKIY